MIHTPPIGPAILIVIATVWLVVAASLTAAASEDKPLDDQLMEGLDNELFDDLDTIPDPGRPDTAKRPTADEPPLDSELIDGLLEGDDIGDDSDLHLRIGKRMQIAQERIRTRNTAATTQRLQRQVIDDLDRLIEKVKKAKCCGSGDGQPQAAPPGQKKAGKPSNAQGRTAANDSRPTKSTERVGETESSEARIARYRALVKQVWGHLPERIRQRMPNTADEEFLPKYSDLIEDYFQRLAEEGGERGPGHRP
jgi:hypothetical protein